MGDNTYFDDGRMQEVELEGKAVLSSRQRENLPDSAYACPEKRKYPHHKPDGSLDRRHLLNALARIADPGNDQCGKAHLEAHAKAEGIGERKGMQELKASLIDDNHFRLLAIPFGGPIKGRDLDGEYFTARTDIKPTWFAERPVLWHHGQDRTMADTVFGKAVLDEEPEEDGWWVDVWLNHGEKRTKLIKLLAEKAPIYGSSGTIGYLKKAAPSGELLVWPYVEQTLTTSPQNTYSVMKPAKAVLDAFDSAEIPVDRAVKALLTDLEALSADLTPTSDVGEEPAMAGADLDRLVEAWNAIPRLREE